MIIIHIVIKILFHAILIFFEAGEMSYIIN